MSAFLSSIGQPVEDAEEESFFLFTRPIPSANLGFVDARAPTVDIPIHGNDYTIRQSPTLLSSARAGGTTGAVLWKITPVFAEWISLPTNPLWASPGSPLADTGAPGASTVVELGCGISGLLALALGPWVRYYIATDQEYVQRLLRENLEANREIAYGNARKHGGGGGGNRKGRSSGRTTASKKRGSSTKEEEPNITFTGLDWETDDARFLKQSDGVNDNEDKGFDLLLSCDCIYNEALVAPFVRTCADICRLRPSYSPDQDDRDPTERKNNPTICIIAQQQRSPDVFETWLQETLRFFWVWRLEDEVLGDGLKAGTGYVVHLLVLR